MAITIINKTLTDIDYSAVLRRPMKAPTKSILAKEYKLLPRPVFGSFKYDGFRATKGSKAVHTSSMKLIENRYVQKQLKDMSYFGLDCELVVGSPIPLFSGDDVFKRTSGPLRAFEGEPNFGAYIFDAWDIGSTHKYHKRLDILRKRYEGRPHVTIVDQVELYTDDDILEFVERCVTLGYEGAMLRNPMGYYKQGRCTLPELNIFKDKPFVDSTCRVIGFVEANENTNEKVVSELGTSKRSSHKVNMKPKGTLGKFHVVDKAFTEPFYLGCGKISHKKAKEIWDAIGTPDTWLGKYLDYKYQLVGSTPEAPRLPIFQGRERAPEDLTEY